MLIRHCPLLVGLVALMSPAVVHALEPSPAPAGSAYQIVLRSRRAEAAPTRTKDAQTGGGSIVVEQPEPNTIVITMGGSAVVGSEFHGSAAGMDFNLEQDLDIISTREGLRPPRIGMVGRVVGTVQVSNTGHCNKSCGSADQGPATASLIMEETNLLTVTVDPSAVTTGQELSINHRNGPVESQAAVGTYHLIGSFHIGVTQGKGVFNRQSAVADFDPAPQLDAFWSDALKPFRAVPRKDFGFKIVVRVIEDSASEMAPPQSRQTSSLVPEGRRSPSPSRPAAPGNSVAIGARPLSGTGSY